MGVPSQWRNTKKDAMCPSSSSATSSRARTLMMPRRGLAQAGMDTVQSSPTSFRRSLMWRSTTVHASTCRHGATT
ncbi:hypothetical protein ATCV1_z555L [Acanthocystis turfacea chlorella virus 1]|uniref:Uncharacterized protein z555L n=1 Tax=Chlorovirus heliozoae TaxID=322019 RepID=A7K9G5_9PHYC|nr:hypothetical protein ATCV1_z555L [Acanthocystis turfacea chlorella virus 1]ABT16689.1 hypothetical protein ATCV1_z555L [Acanthocystis turfacea chlorella virus 1]